MAAPKWVSPVVDQVMRKTLADLGMKTVLLKQLTPPGLFGSAVVVLVVKHSPCQCKSAVTLCQGLPAWLGEPTASTATARTPAAEARARLNSRLVCMMQSSLH